MCKDIWDGSGYLPEVFHKWVDDSNGAFIGAFDNNRLVSFGKYSVLIDNQGWLEDLRRLSKY
ncbi:hypothetical protein CHL78_018930 [Romboutsia weinsteinii]|uniref:GNAT family N-acetyltransferase n=1 Tax=Romboutsia weinsteinii TaxID=2020949 RepID=A0A371IXS4_9FIRM|nr:hypothetical protein [Romboutsia weinsteinii]RDY25292.1 hypothetical protein CHL78_018930 [Romboutsia weinsteinii]